MQTNKRQKAPRKEALFIFLNLTQAVEQTNSQNLSYPLT